MNAAAADVAQIADALGIGRFAVVGRSGGAPHALACAALLPDRTTRVAALVSLALRGGLGLDWIEGVIELMCASTSTSTWAEPGDRDPWPSLAALRAIWRRRF
ncbi:alpha/beta fold hydrolase [Streptomyces sp. NPDC002643]